MWIDASGEFGETKNDEDDDDDDDDDENVDDDGHKRRLQGVSNTNDFFIYIPSFVEKRCVKKRKKGKGKKTDQE